MHEDEQRALAERVRDACVAAAQSGYEDASIAGLCAEGALEAAISAIENLDMNAVLAQKPPENNPPHETRTPRPG